MNSLSQKLLVAFCLATGLTTAAQAQFTFFPYTSAPSQQTNNPVVENRSMAAAPSAQPVEKHAHKSHKNMAAH